MESNQKVKYQKSRYLVKKWESEFKNCKGYVPSKNDIKTAPKRIKDAYSTYWKLKTLLLESSLIDATLDENAKDCFSLSVAQAVDSTLPEPTREAPLHRPSGELALHQSSGKASLLQPSSDSALLQPSLDSALMPAGDASLLQPNCVLQSSADNVLQQTRKKSPDKTKSGVVSKPAESSPTIFKFLTSNVEKNAAESSDKDGGSVWGSHLSIKPNKNIRIMKEKSVSFQYSEKLFAGAKFSKRNPRKPGSFKRNKTFDALPDLSSRDTSSSLMVDVSKLNSSLNFVEPDTSVTESNRVVSNAGEGEVGCDSSNFFKDRTSLNIMGENGGSGHFNLDSEVQRVIIKEAPKIQYQGVSVVGALLGGNRAPVRVTRQVDSGWLGRLDSDSGIASGSGPAGDSSDELICDSDEESKSRFALNSSSIPSIPRHSECDTISLVPSSNTLLPSRRLDICKPDPVPNAVISKTLQLETVSFSSKLGTEKAVDGPKTCKRATPGFPLQSTTSIDPTPPAKKLKLDNCTPAVQAEKARAAKKRVQLEKKVSSGAANKNFVKIDIKKKVYTRGKKGMSFSKYKKKQWKELKGLNSSGVITCFKCGDVGHMAKQCKAVGELLPHEECDEESIFPSLEDAEKAAAKQAPHYMNPRSSAIGLQNNTLPLPEEDNQEAVKPLYSLKEDGCLPETPDEVHACLGEIGYTSFLPGQEEAVMSVLCGKSCLVVLPTGSGKSLCYRLPALLYHRHRQGSLTLVVSPLVSLMEDQVLSSGSSTVGCLHHCQSEKQRSVIEQRLENRELSVLLISPELLSSDSSLKLASRLPPIALACIDEAHCLSHWSHNFRPSYLTLCQVLREKLKVRTLLGLTASVTASTEDSVLAALGGVGQVSLIRSKRFLPENLVLSVSRDVDREVALLTLLRASRFASCSSIIVYCTRREECVRIAAFLRTHLQDSKRDGRKTRLSPDAEVYHAGLTPARRKQVQNGFMTGKVRIVVATVAFGMGINKRDLRGVIHFNMPSSLENYLQEIGRAGRDGLTAHCHLFLSPASGDVSELKRHIYSSSVDRGSLRRLLELTSSKCNGCSKRKHEVAVCVESAVEQLDLAQEVISTLLAYLASTELGYALLPHAYTRARVSSYKGPAHLALLAKECGVLGVGLAQARASGAKVTSSAEFDVIRLADTVSWNSGQVKRVLKQLEWTKTEDGKWSKSGLNVELILLGFRLIVPCGLSDDEQDAALDLLHQRTEAHEQTALKQLYFLHNCLHEVSYKSVADCAEDIDMRRCEKLASFVHKYFTCSSVLQDIAIKEKEVECESDVLASIKSVVSSGEQGEWTGRSVARILHGISSPNFPAVAWGRTPFWRRHLDQDFTAILRLASQHLRSIR